MVIDDIIYIGSIVFCVFLGSYYKTIEDVNVKKKYGAGVGLLVAFLICGHYIYHTFIMVWSNIIIIKCCDKRYIHQLSLGFTWVYVLYLSYNLQNSKYVIWLFQGLALRLVGLAFEVYLSEKSKTEPKLSGTKLNQEDLLSSEPSAADVLTYAYFFIGIHKGPYYKIKVYNDYFNLPFSVMGDFRTITMQKLKKAGICAIAYILLLMKFPIEVYYEETFYTENSPEYRFLYNIPQLLVYFLQHQIVMTLCNCICTESGFGVYPSKCNSLPGMGPSTNYSLLKITSLQDNNLNQEYNFAMIKCFDNEKILTGPMLKHSVRAWDMPTQYWFWVYIYKNLLRSNKEVRSACSFLAWSIWCGPTSSQIILSTTLWVYIHLENEFNDLYNTSSSTKVAWNIGYTIMRLLFLVYMTPCLTLHSSVAVFKYYGSIYWAFHVLLMILVMSAIIGYKYRMVSDPGRIE